MTDELQPRGFVPGPAAMVSGAAAVLLDGFLRRHADDWRQYAAEMSRDRKVGMETTRALMAIEAAANAHRDGASAISADPLPAAETVGRSSGMGTALTVSEAASRLGVSDRRVRQLVSSCELAGFRSGGRWHVDAESVEARRVKS